MNTLRQSPVLRALIVLAFALALAGTSAPRPADAATSSSGGWTTSAAVSPSTLDAGQSATITAKVKSSRKRRALIDVEVYSPSHGKIFQRAWDQERFKPGKARRFTAVWDVPAAASGGTYVVKVGVFDTGWGALRHWDDQAASFEVTTGTSPTEPPLPPTPAGWPGTVELGMSSAPGDSTSMRDTAPFGFRYQYLAGGVNTGNGWAHWNPDGSFVTYYIDESRRAGILPVFTYYMLYQSQPGVTMSESTGVHANLTNSATMAAYYRDLKLFFQRAGAAGGTTVFHVEPDLWAFMQQRATNDDASTVPVQVAGSGMAEVAGLPDTAAGFAQAIVRLRDRYASNVVLGYHFSTWGTGKDITYSDPSDTTVDALGARTARFYASLGAGFDIAFTDIADRDAAFKQYVYGDGGASWFTADDYRRSTIYIGAFVREAGIRAVLWQLPYGNTKMRAVNNTWNHYQDNKVEWLLDEPARTHLDAYTTAGVVAYLFGAGAGGATCACDANRDGVTNPSPINGNTAESLSADDDGGFFRDRAAGYYAEGATALR